MAVAFALVIAPPARAEEVVGMATITDGDTFVIGREKIRLSGVDAPERGKRCGNINVYQRATLALSDLTGRNTVHCIINGSTFGRKSARCSAGGVDLAARMAQLGWARDWPRYSGGAYAAEEASARAARRGIWGLQCPSTLWGNRNYGQRW